MPAFWVNVPSIPHHVTGDSAYATNEDIYAKITREGVIRGQHVVPEFRVSSREHQFEKKIDVAWLRPRADPNRVGSLRCWQIVAAFEIEGFKVPLKRLRIQSAQFKKLRAEEGTSFPCFVPLYNRSYPRAVADWGSETPEARIHRRVVEAGILGNVAQVIDGRDPDWPSQVFCD